MHNNKKRSKSLTSVGSGSNTRRLWAVEGDCITVKRHEVQTAEACTTAWKEASENAGHSGPAKNIESDSFPSRCCIVNTCPRSQSMLWFAGVFMTLAVRLSCSMPEKLHHRAHTAIQSFAAEVCNYSHVSITLIGCKQTCRRMRTCMLSRHAHVHTRRNSHDPNAGGQL